MTETKWPVELKIFSVTLRTGLLTAVPGECRRLLPATVAPSGTEAVCARGPLSGHAQPLLESACLLPANRRNAETAAHPQPQHITGLPQGRRQASGSICVVLGYLTCCLFKTRFLSFFYVTDRVLGCCATNPTVPRSSLFLLHGFVTW